MELPGQFPPLGPNIPLVQAQALRILRRGFGPLDGNTVEGCFGHLAIGAVGAVHGQPQRDPLGIDQQAAFDTLLGAIGRVFARLFPPRGVLWSCTRPCSARTSRYLYTRRRPSGPSPTSP